MSDLDHLGDAFANLSGIQDNDSGKLGYYVNGAWRVVDPDDPKRFLVRFVNGTHVSALHLNRVPQKYDLNVLVGKDHLGRPIILGEDRPSNENFHSATSGGTSVGWHIHPRASGMEFITDEWLLKHLRPTSSSGNFTVTISAGSYMYHGELRWKSSGSLNLSAYVPSSSPRYRWVIVGINPVTDSFVSAGGTETIWSSLPPDPNGIPLIPFVENGYIPLAAIWLLDGDVGIPSTRIQDLRHSLSSVFWYLGDLVNVSDYYDYEYYVLMFRQGRWIAQPGALGSFNQTIQDEGINLAQRSKINFIGPNIAATDNLGQARTDVTILDPPSLPITISSAYILPTDRQIVAGRFEFTGSGSITLQGTASIYFA